MNNPIKFAIVPAAPVSPAPSTVSCIVGSNTTPKIIPMKTFTNFPVKSAINTNKALQVYQYISFEILTVNRKVYIVNIIDILGGNLVLSKSRQKMILLILKKGKLKSSEQTVYNTPGEFYTCMSYFRENGLIGHNAEPQIDTRYMHSYYLTDHGKILAYCIKSLDSSENYYDKEFDCIAEVTKLLGVDNK